MEVGPLLDVVAQGGMIIVAQKSKNVNVVVVKRAFMAYMWGSLVQQLTMMIDVIPVSNNWQYKQQTIPQWQMRKYVT